VAALILDATVLIGLLDTADAHHAVAIDDVEAADRAGTPLLTPASAYSEALVSFARAGRVADAREAVAGMGISVTPLTSMIAERAAQLRAGHDGLRLPDAIVLATAQNLDADLLTYDDRLSRLAGQSSD
jgi:predicted nucleic acid-binding protein